MKQTDITNLAIFFATNGISLSDKQERIKLVQHLRKYEELLHELDFSYDCPHKEGVLHFRASKQSNNLWHFTDLARIAGYVTHIEYFVGGVRLMVSKRPVNTIAAEFELWTQSAVHDMTLMGKSTKAKKKKNRSSIAKTKDWACINYNERRQQQELAKGGGVTTNRRIGDANDDDFDIPWG